MNPPSFTINDHGQLKYSVAFDGSWTCEFPTPDLEELLSLPAIIGCQLQFIPAERFLWDSSFMALLLKMQRQSTEHHQNIDLNRMPAQVLDLLNLATAIPAQNHSHSSYFNFFQSAMKVPDKALGWGKDVLEFTGDISLSLVRLVKRRSDTRFSDFIHFLDQAGPSAIPIVTLLSFLVGMILAYLGTVQLRQLGAEVYVANLVGLGMVREMGALMTAVIMAGRTGAAYAAQLGTMQVNEEIDALTTLGIKPVDYLVLPRVLALTLAMPLLTLYSNILGMAGGAAVALGMDITFTQYVYQLSEAFTLTDVLTGLFKSLVFGVLISFAGCQAGLQCGRSSAAVGQATTTAVVTAIVYLVVADAGLNILFFKLGI